MKKEYLVSAKEMKQYDYNTIQKIGIPSMVLMERAAYAIAMETLSMLEGNKNGKILILAGNGNNGADGVCAGRILKEHGCLVDYCLLKSTHAYTDELQRQIDVAQYYELNPIEEEQLSLKEYDVIVDAIFGIGLNREISGSLQKLIERLNDSKKTIISADIPSGIDATTGKVLGCAVRATVTVTFGFYKSGQMFYPGRLYCGIIKKARIGINETGFFNENPKMFTYLPGQQEIDVDCQRNPMGNKGSFGKVFIIAGRGATTGAAILCATSALRSGCGMVAVLTEQDNKEMLMQKLPEAMVETYTDKDTSDSLLQKLQKWEKWCDTMVIGCGLGRDEMAYNIMRMALQNCQKSVVCDADALQLVAKYDDLAFELYVLAQRLKKDNGAVVFTPHPGELAALANCSISDVKENRITVIEQVLKKYPVILVAKDADTLVCAKDEKCYLNVTGNDGLATAGSGDVLAGLIGSMIAGGLKNRKAPFEATCESVFFHGKAADELTKENAKSFLVASDLIEAYKYILK